MNGTLLVAIGNPLRGDDGVAWRLGEIAPRGWTTEYTIQLTPEWASTISAYQRVVFADASLDCCEPRLLQTAAASESGSLSHSVTPAAVIALATQLFGFHGEALTLHIPAFSFDTADSLSPECSIALDRAVQLLNGLSSGGPVPR